MPFFSSPGSLCLRNVHVVVPEAVELGSKVEMKCLYDLEQEVLYSVKWYRGDREFCRYSPRDVPPLKIFRIPGIEVDVSFKLSGPTFKVRVPQFSFRELLAVWRAANELGLYLVFMLSSRIENANRAKLLTTMYFGIFKIALTHCAVYEIVKTRSDYE